MTSTDSAVRIPEEQVRAEGRVKVTVGSLPVVVLPFEDDYVAYVDICAHQGGPVCSEGSLHPYLTAEIDPDTGRVSDVWAPGGERVIACPWHGWEYWLENGELIADPTKRLRKATVARDGADLVVTL